MIHTHHIKPKHAGGTDDPSNLVKLTIQDHAEAHKWLFIENGQPEDALAWMALYGQIDYQEARLEALKEALKRPERGQRISKAKKGIPNPKVAAALKGKPSPKDANFRHKVRNTLREYYKTHDLPVGFGDGSAWLGRKHKEETKQNQSKLFKNKTWKLIDGKRVWMDR